MSASFHFQQLTPELMLDALAQVSLLPASGLQALNSFENRVYQFKTDDQQRFVVKFYRPERWSNTQILEEHQFSEELAAAGLPVIAPLKFAGQTLHQWQQQRFALFSGVAGRPFYAESLDDYAALGELTGKLHAISQRQSFQHRGQLNIGADVALACTSVLQSALLPTALYDAYQQLLNQLSQLCQQYPTPSHTVRLHGDLHAGNLLSTPGLQLLDFDDCLQGPALQDCWLLLQGEPPEQQLQLDIFLDEYQNHCDFDWSELALLHPLRCRRQLCYLAWLLNRWADPAFPHHFPWLTELSFWQQQLQNLQQLLPRLAQGLTTSISRPDNFGNC